jgi:hypothetical protein
MPEGENPAKIAVEAGSTTWYFTLKRPVVKVHGRNSDEKRICTQPKRDVAKPAKGNPMQIESCISLAFPASGRHSLGKNARINRSRNLKLWMYA